jgi:hypothetical protein
MGGMYVCMYVCTKQAYIIGKEGGRRRERERERECVCVCVLDSSSCSCFGWSRNICGVGGVVSWAILLTKNGTRVQAQEIQKLEEA